MQSVHFLIGEPVHSSQASGGRPSFRGTELLDQYPRDHLDPLWTSYQQEQELSKGKFAYHKSY
jgi:hypothetical protein